MAYKNPEDAKAYYLRNRTRINVRKAAVESARRAADPEAPRERDRAYYRNSPAISAANKRKQTRRRAWYAALLSTMKCATCDETEPLFLDMHHFNPADKERDVSRVARHWSPIRIIEELNKCVPLCCKCHRLHHAGRLRPLTPEDMLRIPLDTLPPKTARINALTIGAEQST